MEIKRDIYLNKLIESKDNDMVKVITGVRRCGKSYLLFNLFYKYLIENGVDEEQIITISLDNELNFQYHNLSKLSKYLRSKIADGKKYYIFIDEVQLIKPIINKDTNEKITFHYLLMELMKKADVYVTGSNSKMLSTDVITEFRGRGDEIRVHPLSFKEFSQAYSDLPINKVWKLFSNYGSLPYITKIDNEEKKTSYLTNLFKTTYIKDILERFSLRNEKELLNIIIKFLSDNIGSLTNPLTLSNTFKSEAKININPKTINNYISYFIDAFILEKVERYDIKGKKIITTPSKYYFADLGIRNGLLGFNNNLGKGKLMENAIYNHLIINGYDVKIGNVEEYTKDKNNKTVRKTYEIDFVATKYDNTIYIQSCFRIDEEEKHENEIRGLKKVTDYHQRIMVLNGDFDPYYDENKILHISITDFLLNKEWKNII